MPEEQIMILSFLMGEETGRGATIGKLERIYGLFFETTTLLKWKLAKYVFTKSV